MSVEQNILNRLKYKSTRKNAFNDLKRALSENIHNVKNVALYNCINYIASHTYFFSNGEYEEIAHLALSNKVITNKQKENIRLRINNRDDIMGQRLKNLLELLIIIENDNYIHYDESDDFTQL